MDMITKAGAVIAILLFVVLLIKFFVQLRGSTLSPSQKRNQFVQILIISIVILVIAVPEGLPLAVTLALAYATTGCCGTMTSFGCSSRVRLWEMSRPFVQTKQER